MGLQEVRDISELLKQEKPTEQLTDAEIMQQLAEEDRRMMFEFSDEPSSQRPRVRIRTRRWT